MMKNPASPVATQGHSKTYVLGMFPYPSGEGLHVGHVRIFTACDVMARYFRMKQMVHNRTGGHGGPPLHDGVLSPMGWDAFGLPAENAAIKFKKIPQEMVPHNYANFRRQMEDLSLDFDWERELATSDPEYYAITQWIFLQIYKKGLVYREKVAINWCPKCLTGLANEEVMADGTHERCGMVVGKKLLPQWVMKITDYAERLLNDLEKEQLDWPRGILEMQKNWIGKGVGLSIDFSIEQIKQSVTAWTKYWETIYGVTFIVIAPEVAEKWMKNGWQADKDVIAYITKSLQKSEQQRQEDMGQKTGVDTGLTAINPVNGETVPVWVADYVLSNVGTGMVMGVPSHDERDFDFAKKFNLNLKQVVKYSDESIDQNVREGKKSYEGEGELINSGEFTGMSAWGEGKKRMAEWLVKNGYAKEQITYHLRDWVFSRQRYWGEPIPLVYCDKCGVVPLPEDQLPLTLPLLESYEPTDTGESPLSRVTDWVNTKCHQCGGPATRETDTMPNWAGSCWYFLAFAFWGQVKLPARPGPAGRNKDLQGQALSDKPYTDWWMKTALPKIKEWLPVDWYLGGAEHAVLHLLYARFWVKVLQDLELVGFPEPFLRLRSVGLVLAEDGKKMSKSIGNVVNPDDMVEKYGSDAVRMYEMFMGPWEQSIAWDSGAISGQVRFLGRVRETVAMKGKTGEKTSPLLAAKLKTLVERVERGVLEQKFNTAIARLMEFVNSWREEGMILSKEHVKMFASLLSLFAPITAEEIWKQMQATHSRSVGALHSGSVWGQWPDVSAIEGVDEVMVTIAVQINGKLRGTVGISKQESENREKVVSRAMGDERVKKWITGEPKKMIFVPGRLVNLVV